MRYFVTYSFCPVFFFLVVQSCDRQQFKVSRCWQREGGKALSACSTRLKQIYIYRMRDPCIALFTGSTDPPAFLFLGEKSFDSRCPPVETNTLLFPVMIDIWVYYTAASRTAPPHVTFSYRIRYLSSHKKLKSNTTFLLQALLVQSDCSHSLLGRLQKLNFSSFL